MSAMILVTMMELSSFSILNLVKTTISSLNPNECVYKAPRILGIVLNN